MGRRGTGKTYLLHMLERQLSHEKCCIVHIDCRTLRTWNVDNRSHLDSYDVSRIGLHFFWNFLREVCLSIRRCPYFKTGLFNSKHPIDAIENLSTITAVPEQYEQQNEASISRKKKLSGVFSSATSISWGFENGHDGKIQQNISYEVTEQIRPTEIYNAFNAELEQYKVHVYILIDEWSFMPPDIQPYIADLIKQCLLPCKWICLKAIPHNANCA